MDLKKALYNFCQQYSLDRVIRIEKRIIEVQLALTSETKSSAGDKHETGRAMLQLEREKLGQQLAEAEQMKLVLAKVPLASTTNVCSLGSLVYTEKETYYLAISAGEYRAKDSRVYCISAATPIGQLLLGKKVEDTFMFRGKERQIKEIM